MIFNVPAQNAKFEATVTVTWPNGTTSCTLSKGNTTLTATISGSSYTFTVREPGTWVATASNGSKTTTGNASVTTSGSSYSITLPAYPVDPPTPTATQFVVITNKSIWNIMSDDYPSWEPEPKGAGTTTVVVPGAGTFVFWGLGPTIYATQTISDGQSITVSF